MTFCSLNLRFWPSSVFDTCTIYIFLCIMPELLRVGLGGQNADVRIGLSESICVFVDVATGRFQATSRLGRPIISEFFFSRVSCEVVVAVLVAVSNLNTSSWDRVARC